MRDIVKDAAIITVAKQAMSENGWMDVMTFVRIYSDSREDRGELLETLTTYGLIWQEYQKSKWELEGRYVYRWIIDED